ncbi:hypothetical protein GCM10012286_20180 [Streptomyces lasiicapitis]|uniref:Uncharacterized protein n=1 Tax=Streptomyces lasiicapitis TaxID=1923961 RepID=A0ABQ2LNT0_9ACTN|nr:hypothetical protein GCM10012286_20180 [Streptomyces lasiicapitis]
MPNPISASPPAVRRCSSTPLRIRSRQYAPLPAQSATNSQLADPGPCTEHLLDRRDIVDGSMPGGGAAYGSAQRYGGRVT